MYARNSLVVGAIGLGVFAAGLEADVIQVEPIEVGSGLFSSFVQVDFQAGATFVFEVFYNDGATSSFDLLLTLDADEQLGFELEYTPFDFGPFVTGLGYEGIFESGDGSNGEPFWGFWAKDHIDGTWAFPGAGAGDHLAGNGSWSGWVFGNGQSPVDVVIPAPGAAALLAGFLVARGSRRRVR